MSYIYSTDGIKDLNNHIKANKDKNIVLFFGSEHCGACKAFKEKLKLSHSQLSNTVFLYINNANNANDELYIKYNVMYLPSLFFIRLNGNRVKILETVEGYDWEELVEKYNKIK